jgi:DNA-binding CsgD family transcriptional regulator
MPSKLLTPRQHEILQLIADGLTSAEIAERLHRSVRTVESHRFEIGQRLGARNTPELLRKARLAGLLTESQRSEYDGTAPRTDSQALENMLLSLSAVAKSAETGASLLQNLCSRMVDAFGVQAAVISRVTERGSVEALASWPDSGTFPSSEWDLESSPCSRLPIERNRDDSCP